MGKASITSTTSNVRFYSSSGTMGNVRSGGSRFCYGPRRVICFCLLAVITPSIFVSTVLLMRFVFNGTATYHINPSDMRILDHKISTTWCQSEKIKMNTTFTAFLTSGEPHLVKAPAPLTTTKTLIIPDDHKEYWGFYLLKGSTFRIRTCARHKGGTLLIVKGRSHLHHCAYIGEADSAGDSDEFSNSMSLEDESDPGVNRTNSTSHRLRQQLLASQTASSTEEISLILAKIRAFIRNRPKGFTRIKDNLSKWMLIVNETTTAAPTTTATPQTTTTTTAPSHILPAAEVDDLASSQVGGPSLELDTQPESSPPHHKLRHENSRKRHRRHRHAGRAMSTEDQMGSRQKRSLQTSRTSAFGLAAKSVDVREQKKAPSGVGRKQLLDVHEHGTIRRHRRNVDVRKSTDSGEDGAFEDSNEEGSSGHQDYEFPPLDLNSVGRQSGGSFPVNSKINAATTQSHTRNLENNSDLRKNSVEMPSLSTKTGAASDTDHESLSGNKTKPARRQDTPNSIWEKEHSHHTGSLDDPNPHPSIDGSDSESESSFSSSEEALAKCEGVVASLYLKPTANCGLNEAGGEDPDGDGEDEIPIFYEDVVNASGYYYFIFGSENEKRDNFIRARFELEKFVYELPPAIDNCTDVTQCHVNLTFWSSQKLVVQIPQPAPEQESIWDEVYLAETECEPRVLLYLIFVVVVPISIILCAFQ